MNLRFLRKKSPGQSLPIIALVIIVIVGMVALSVDLGNTYAKQRSVVRAAEAASVSAMQVTIDGASDGEVASALYASLHANGIYTDTYTVVATYRKEDGTRALPCDVGDCGDLLENTLKKDIAYIDITINGENATFFASVLGQDQLPLNASSFAGQCAPTTGVYPIAISPNSIGWVRDPLSLEEGGVGTQKGFLPPEIAEMEHYFIYSSGGGDNFDVDRLRQRRIYLKDDLSNGGTFSYVRWRNDQKDLNDVQAMFHVDGNLEEGLEEEPLVGNPPVPGDPVESGILSPGDDWLSSLDVETMGNIDLSSGPIAQELDYHIKNRTLMILPIMNDAGTPVEESGGNTTRYAYQIHELGNFLLVDHGKDDQDRQYLDLVYVSDAEPVACPSDTIPDHETYGITGRVRVEPLAENELADDIPTQFVIVMDVSGSMNLNFLGQGSDKNGNPKQCAKSGDPALDRYIDLNKCEGKGSSPYPDQLQRRNAVVKHALIDHFANRMRAIDSIGLVSYSTNSKIEYYQHQSTSPEAQLHSGGRQYWFYGDNPADKGRLEEVILKAGAQGGDPYRTSGSTGAARGLRSADELLRDADTYGTRTAPALMPDTPYKRVVIFLTDGVANIFLDPVNGKKSIEKSLYDDNCPQGEGDISGSIPCNMGVLGPPKYSQEIILPVTAMINQSQDVLQEERDADVFALAVGQVGEMGLTDVASQPAFFTRAARAEQIGTVFSNVRRQAVTGCGVVGVPGRWLDTISASSYPLDSAWANADGTPKTDPPAVDLTADPKVVGYVTILPELGSSDLEKRIPIEIESDRYDREVMSFKLDQTEGLPPGSYRYTAFVVYKGADNTARMYDTIYDVDQATTMSEGTIYIPDSDSKDILLEPIHLKLSETETICSSGADPNDSGDTGDNPTETPTQETPTQETPTQETPTQETPTETLTSTQETSGWTNAPADAPIAITLDDSVNSTYEITFKGATNNNGQSIWNYFVEEKSGKDLSHWTLELPACVNAVPSIPADGTVGDDPTTGLSGVKWDLDDNFVKGDFIVAIDATGCDGGDVEVGSADAAVKAGNEFKSGSVTAPVDSTP